MALMDTIGPILQLMQIMNQQRATEGQLAGQRYAVNRQAAGEERKRQDDLLASLLPMIRSMPNSEASGPFLESLAGSRTGLDIGSLMAMAQAIAPTGEALQSGAARQGRVTADPARVAKQNEAAADAATGFNPLQAGIQSFLFDALEGMDREAGAGIGRAAVLKQLTGMAPGEFALSSATAGLPAEQLTGAARVGLDLQVGAGGQLSAAVAQRGQNLGHAVGMANNRLGWAELAQRSAQQQLELGIRQQVAQLEAYGRNSLSANDIPELLGTAARLAENLQKSNEPLVQQQNLAALGALNQLLNRQFGIATPQIDPLGGLGDQAPMNPGFNPQAPNPFAGRPPIIFDPNRGRY